MSGSSFRGCSMVPASANTGMALPEGFGSVRSIKEQLLMLPCLCSWGGGGDREIAQTNTMTWVVQGRPMSLAINSVGNLACNPIWISQQCTEKWCWPWKVHPLAATNLGTSLLFMSHMFFLRRQCFGHNKQPFSIDKPVAILGVLPEKEGNCLCIFSWVCMPLLLQNNHLFFVYFVQ